MSDPGGPPATTHIHQEAHAQGQARVYQAGRDQHFHHVSQPVRWPVWVGVLPPEADCYQPRMVAESVSAITTGGAATVLCQLLSGLGGVGKTQLAAAHARHLWHMGELDLLVWVPAASRSAIVSSYAQTHCAVTGRNIPDAEQAAADLLAWLASTDRRWLIVLDDLTDPGDLRGLWPPKVAVGRTMVTTRRRDAALAGPGRILIDIDLFTPAEADSYLAARLATRPNLAPGAAELAHDLGYLPLALAQATAYLIDRSLTCAQYSERLTNRRRRLAELLPEPGALPDDHKASVAAAWSLSIELADSLAPVGLARPVIELASMLDSDGIPEGVFTTEAATRLMGEAAGRAVDAESARDALHCLNRVSLATLDEANPARSVRVHGLVQRVTRDQLPADRLILAAQTAADALVQAWPSVERDPEFGQVLRASATALAARNADSLWVEEGGHPVLFRAGGSLGEAGQVAVAASYFEQLGGMALARLGPDHPDTLTTRRHLAWWRGEAGEVGRATADLEELLTDCLRVLGPDHPDTLTTRRQLAWWRGDAGDADGAAAAFEELLTDFLRLLGPNHPDTLTVRRNLAYWRKKAGNAGGAVAAVKELLIDYLRALGPDHPHTLIARTNLAWWRGDAGDAAGAAAAFEELLTDRLRVLGPDHPHTLGTRRHLAWWGGEAGDADGAAAALEELLTDCLRVLGPDHPDTLTTRRDLARWRGEAGDADGAAAALEELLTDCLRVLGPDHPDTLTTKSSLAYWRGRQRMSATPPDVTTFTVVALGSNIRTAPSTSEGEIMWVANQGDTLIIDATTRAEQVPDYNYCVPEQHMTDVWYQVHGGGWVSDGVVTGYPPDGWNVWIDWASDPPAITEPEPEPPPGQPIYGPPLMSSYIDLGALWHPVPASNFTADRRDRIASGELIGKSYDLARGGWIVMHHMVGSTDSAEAEFMQVGSEKSAHYGIGQDGSKRQWVDEADGAWHAGDYQCNRKSIGIEHEDGGPDEFTDDEYESSAQVVANVCRRYSIPCARGSWPGQPGVILHSDIVATQCPGALDVGRIIERASAILANPGPRAGRRGAVTSG